MMREGAGLRSRAHTAAGAQVRRLNPAGFSFALAGRGQLLILLFKPMLWSCGRWNRPKKSGGPPPLEPSFKVKRYSTHNPTLRVHGRQTP